MRSQLLWKL